MKLNTPIRTRTSALFYLAATASLLASVGEAVSRMPLRLEVRFLANGAVRVRARESKPLVPRYDETFKHALPESGESLVYASPDDLVMSSAAVDGAEIHVVTYHREGKPSVAIRMTEDPWTLVYLVDDKPVMQLNTSGYFHFEHLRRQPESNLKDVDACWEEPFEEWVDVKQRGPESFGIDITFKGFEHVYGLPEHTSPLALKDTRGNAEGAYNQPYRLFNLDVFDYEIDTPMALYGSIPFMLAHSVEATVGVLWLNASETWVDVVTRKADPELGDQASVNTHWFSESGSMDIFLFPGPTIAEMYSQYADVVGKTPLPREFALGYHQCRWNYDDQADVLDVNAKFHEYNIPYDVLWLDIEYTDGKRYFTWDHKAFPDPQLMQNELAQDGHKLVTITDPHIFVDRKYRIWKEGAANGYFVKDADGSSDYKGSCWPGVSSWVDFTNPEASKWMGEQYHVDNFPESTTDMFVWNDMNEPAVFDGPEHTMPRSLKHHGGWEHRDVHNLYGLLQQKSTYQGLLSRETVLKRPFVLSRSFYAGSHRYGAIWTGDNSANWEHLRMSVPMLLGCNISGMMFCGADVGGFFGNPPPDLLTRWYQLGIWYPFFRAHAQYSSERREPWVLGEPYVSYIRNAIRERYRMLPYWYTLFRETSITGMPVLRPMWM
ncbi:glucosidase II, partial [Coemansia erecta]